MHQPTVYDLVIVGAGIIGSAAARHASSRPEIKVCLIGPEEPKVRQTSSVFAAYYDEGRIIRVLDPTPTRATLNARSINRFKQLERDTGIRFCETVGFLHVANRERATVDQFDNLVKLSKQLKVPASLLAASEIRQEWPHLKISDDVIGMIENNGGYINPRKLVSAEKTAAHLQGCDIINDVVTHLTRINQSKGRECMKVVTEKGAVFYADKVLLATGAFTHFYPLLPDGLTPDAVHRTQSVVFGEVSKNDVENLKNLPVIIYKGSFYNSGLPPDKKKDGFYFLPPLPYPDGRPKLLFSIFLFLCPFEAEVGIHPSEIREISGKFYMKIGHHGHFEKEIKEPEDMKTWYCNPVPLEYKAEMTQWLKKLFPDVRFKSFSSDSCLSTHTNSTFPFIDLIHPRLGIAIGGNGYAAKSGDEIGRMAADLVLRGIWEHDLPAELFKFQSKINPTMSKL